VEVLLTLSILRQHRTVNAGSLARVVQRTADEAQQVLARMAATPGLVEATKRTAASPMPNYRLRPEALAGLGSAVRYHVPSIDMEDRKVVEHVREYGFITNATLRRLFDIDVYTARNLLRFLQARGVLKKAGERAYGPKVRYGRGQDFPHD
jgi:ATP-dependent DNA helicase RecG